MIPNIEAIIVNSTTLLIFLSHLYTNFFDKLLSGLIAFFNSLLNFGV